LLFPYREAGLVPWKELAKVVRRTAAYLEQCRQFLTGREHGKMKHDAWYAYVYPKNLWLFQKSKLMVQVISKKARYAIENTGAYFTGGGNGPYYGLLLKEGLSPEYALGLLNSRLLDYLLHSISSPFRGGYWSYGKRFIEQLPIRTIDFSNKADKARHDKMVELVTRMMELKKQQVRAPKKQSPSEKQLLDQKLAITDQQIDALVYELYGLTDEEVQIVEGGVQP
jgi:hypothetical protein